MVVIKVRKLLRCCYNCRFADIDWDAGIITCTNPPNDKVNVEPTGICQWFTRVIVDDRANAPEVVQGQEPEEV